METAKRGDMKKALQILEEVVPSFNTKVFGSRDPGEKTNQSLYFRLWVTASDFDAARDRMIDASKVLSDRFSQFVTEVEGSSGCASPARSTYIQDLIALEEKVRMGWDEILFLLRILEGTEVRDSFTGRFSP
jgi:hypothetical protein